MAASCFSLALPAPVGDRRRYAAVTARVRANLAERRRVLRQAHEADASRGELYGIHALDTRSRRDLAAPEARPVEGEKACTGPSDADLHC